MLPAVTALLLALLPISISGAATSPRPHIILIVADDLGYNDVSFHGSEQIPTPNIDKLAYSGIILNNYYVSPICTPTRSALMTGRHPIHTGMQHDVILGPQPYGLPLNETLLPQYLNSLGYQSHIVGKWHLGFFEKEYTPLYRGFKSHLGYWLGAEDYFDHTGEANPTMWGLDFRRDMSVAGNYTGRYSTELFTEQAISIINTHNLSQPLFLYLPYQAVHSANQDSKPSPLQAPQKYIDRFPHIHNAQRRSYAAMVSALDDGVGAVYSSLLARGMADNSIVVFTTDNGGPANGFDRNAASNFPLRGLKNTLWEGGVRGVGVVHSPLLERRGYVWDSLLHVCDWLPTLYQAAGGDPGQIKGLDGFPAWTALSTAGPPVRSELLHNIDPVAHFAGLRVGDYKLLTGDVGNHGHDDWYPPWTLSGDEHRLHVDRFRSADWPQFTPRPTPQGRSSPGAVRVECGEKPANASTNCQPKASPCLFHVTSDPCEYNNLAASHPDIVQQMLTRLEELTRSMVPPNNRPPDPRANPKYHNHTWVPWLSS